MAIPNHLNKERMDNTKKRILERKNGKIIRRYKHNFQDPDIQARIQEKRIINRAFKVRTLNERQRMCIKMMTDVSHVHTTAYIASCCGVTRMTIHNWKNDPLFIQELNNEVKKKMSAVDCIAMQHLHRRVRKNQYTAIKDYLKLRGYLTHKYEDVTDKDAPKKMSDIDAELAEINKQLESRGIAVEETSND